ncbi:MAG: GIY-YIG nuclease family protein [Rikenellaceae bacterium]
MRKFYVYIMSNKENNVLYIGVTSDLKRRVAEHRWGDTDESFTHRYNCGKLVYYEEYPTAAQAIPREKELKGWRREWKLNLINESNPNWRDLMGL